MTTIRVRGYKRKKPGGGITWVKGYTRKIDDYQRDYYPQDHKKKKAGKDSRIGGDNTCPDCEGQGYAGPIWDQTICPKCGGDGVT